MKWERIRNKGTARKLFREGKTIYLLPCKMDINHDWNPPTPISLEDNDTFDHLVNQYQDSWCFNEVGYYCHYYIKEGD